MSRTYRYYLVRTAYHGGGIVSRHSTPELAERALQRRYGKTTCGCGCAVVVQAADYDSLPLATDFSASPYEPAR